MIKKCVICNKEFNGNVPHYCNICGNNLSTHIEKQDIVLFASNFFKIIGIIGFLILTFPMVSCAINPLCFDGSCLGRNFSKKDWIITFLPILLIILSFALRRYFKKICLVNIK